MAVREFDGIDDRIILAGTGAQLANAARSMVLLVKPTTLALSEFFVSFARTTNLNPLFAMKCGATDTFWHACHFDTDEELLGSNLSAGAWQILGISKAAGTVVVRGHRKVLGSGVWSHVNSSGTVIDNTDTWTNTEVGAVDNGAGGTFKDMRLAVLALFAANLTDGNYETIESTATTQGIADLSPIGLWEFNQASVATPVEDLIGSADQTSITGTSVVTTDDPAWTFGLGPAVPEPSGNTFDTRVIRHSRRTSW